MSQKKPQKIHETERGTTVTVIPIEGYKLILTESADGHVNMDKVCDIESLIDIFPKVIKAVYEEQREREEKRKKRNADRKKTAAKKTRRKPRSAFRAGRDGEVGADSEEWH